VGGLRRRLILSHLLPLLLIIPFAGIALIYILETQVLLANLASELTGQAVLVAELTAQRPSVWYDPEETQVFVARIGPLLPSQLELFDSMGRLIGSSDPADIMHVGQTQELSGLADALVGKIGIGLSYRQLARGDSAKVFVPVVDSNNRVIGVVGIANTSSSVYERFGNLRIITAGVLAAALVLGGSLGLFLSLNLERPIRQLTEAVLRLTSGQATNRLPERGPEEIRHLQQAFNTLMERLHNLEETRRQLLANIVHELSRPLGAILSAIQALQGGADQEPELRQELLAGMEGEIKRLRRLTSDLTRLHEQLLGTLELDRRPTRLDEWLAEVVAPWREAARVKGLDWRMDIPSKLPVVNVDPDRLTQALSNLINNAIQYTQPEGEISITAGTEGGEIWIRVSDTGPGIEAEEQSLIFTPFYRGKASMRFPQGMGLGLGIARELVISHGGRLEVESTPGEGSHFTLWLPL
jgi:two-component system sensor histidine kinase BaeS